MTNGEEPHSPSYEPNTEWFDCEWERNCVGERRGAERRVEQTGGEGAVVPLSHVLAGLSLFHVPGIG